MLNLVTNIWLDTAVSRVTEDWGVEGQKLELLRETHKAYGRKNEEEQKQRQKQRCLL